MNDNNDNNDNTIKILVEVEVGIAIKMIISNKA